MMTYFGPCLWPLWFISKFWSSKYKNWVKMGVRSWPKQLFCTGWYMRELKLHIDLIISQVNILFSFLRTVILSLMMTYFGPCLWSSWFISKFWYSKYKKWTAVFWNVAWHFFIYQDILRDDLKLRTLAWWNSGCFLIVVLFRNTRVVYLYFAQLWIF